MRLFWRIIVSIASVYFAITVVKHAGWSTLPVVFLLLLVWLCSLWSVSLIKWVFRRYGKRTTKTIDNGGGDSAAVVNRRRVRVRIRSNERS